MPIRKVGNYACYIRKNFENTKMLVYSEHCTESPYPGVTSLALETYRATWMNTVTGTTVTRTMSSDEDDYNFGVLPTCIGPECVIWVRR
jgi:hypothetical protein